uniref:alanine--glyoxylate transaminase n=1 Tax=Polytomella parva TaxID=51329 RepID=A0A6U0TKB8_9CHLO|mmetsp:Transcript_12449/g.22286  ORF Transcript_12449/g.22286 Transcript_12449/m.22286 type:complete len:513 (-) Transcript_12449:1916-3454(-)|eukprot:CAMPEP_0175076372 /NCGR_PEP_ID=MMETSP0052_2-20121109/22686_1 /TAXON_ID=51329 ORGANISM="Polytomella parva, Strain SAG 63-3" /NCGR_SAMPLE_ID=MMETSP0052_2 /ASSEMBLY_ACC=CAM_ASM_000194 /LENGTH=512 /DNA_ID=CAMNT_0016345495 /DNA_START=22 /DNA_END=1560 /DNA_ORIENTATION=+
MQRIVSQHLLRNGIYFSSPRILAPNSLKAWFSTTEAPLKDITPKVEEIKAKDVVSKTNVSSPPSQKEPPISIFNNFHEGYPSIPMYKGPSKKRVISDRKRYLHPSIGHHFKNPVMIVNGKMQYLYDETGRRYLDAFAGIVTVSVGHCHPDVVRAVNAQSKLLQHTTTIYLNNKVSSYAKHLVKKFPNPLNVVYFVNSGSEANDLAMMMARAYTGNFDIISLRNCYHGVSLATMGVCGHHTWKQNMAQGLGIHHALNPDPYRGAFGDDGPRYAADVLDLIRAATPGRVAAFMAETIQGVGGTVPLATGYLPEVYNTIRSHGGVCIADEVQSGFGRTGTHMWGFERQGVVPDIVTLAKGIGNGLPLAAVVTTAKIARSITNRLHFNTFGGNPVSSAGGLATLKVLERDGYMANSHDVGEYLMGKLKGLQAKHDVIGDVRGAGLMLGVELVKDRQMKTPASEETAKVMEGMKDDGVLIGKGGLFGNVFRIKPPMCFTRGDADYLIEVMDHQLGKL